MNILHRFRLDISFFTLIFIGILYILLPSNNNSMDSLAYAIHVRDGYPLFRPHHLLYNTLGYVLTHLFRITGTLSFMCLTNAIFATGCLFMLRSIIRPYVNPATCAALILLTGTCFGFMRFAIDNEPYIIPIFFSLWASRTLLINKKAFATGLLAAIACLFHQIHFFWWLGLLFFIVLYLNGRKTKNFFLYGCASLIVPVVYLLVFYFTSHDCDNIIEYIFHDYFKVENVKLTFKSVTLLLTPINFIRTFIQVHGYIYPLLQKYVYLWTGVILSVICFGWGLGLIRKATSKRRPAFFEKKFAQIHLIIFFLQFLFAAISDGNAEFMVMLPFALCIFFAINYSFRQRFIFLLASGVFIWNFSLALIPYHTWELTSSKEVCRYIEKHPSETYYLKDKTTIENILLYYQPGQKFNLYSFLEGEEFLDNLLSSQERVLTDIYNKGSFSRLSMVSSFDKSTLQDYQVTKVEQLKYDLGTWDITFLEKKHPIKENE